MDDDTAALRALEQRPSIEQEVARLTTMRDAIRDRLAADLDLTAWSDRGNGGSAGCADFPGNDGETRFLSTLLLAGGVPDAQWPQAVEVVADVASAYEFGAPETVVDQPGNHEIVLRGVRESLLRFGSGSVNATLAVGTGCHLPAAVRDAG